MSELGWVEGKNITIEYGFAEHLGRHARRGPYDIHRGPEGMEGPEVDELGAAVFPEANVARTHVAMREAMRAQERE